MVEKIYLWNVRVFDRLKRNLVFIFLTLFLMGLPFASTNPPEYMVVAWIILGSLMIAFTFWGGLFHFLMRNKVEK